MSIRLKLSKLYNDPRKIFQFLYRQSLKVNQGYYQLQGHEGFDIMTEDWDTALILDGCRADMFSDLYEGVEGEYSIRQSPGSESRQFIKRSFQGRSFHDTVYVTANPFISEIDDETFHAVVDLLKEEWDEELATVPPERATKRAITAHKKYPNKRILVHYIQPHYPFLGPTAQHFPQAELLREFTPSSPNPWLGLVWHPKLELSTVLKAYRENAEIVFNAIQPLLKEVTGKIVVTSDHGNLEGERTWPIPIRTYGHPENVYHDNLVSVPWYEIQSEGRREIISEAPIQSSEKEGNIQDPLVALGYQ